MSCCLSRDSISANEPSVFLTSIYGSHLDLIDWIGLSSVLRPRQHSIGYMGDPTNSIKVLNVHIVRREIKHTIIKQ